ncbi:FGGY-family carbohydrate kinase [Thiohalocapsa marina]|uniref:FGGY-family carbohydrate kinase n=1 Tax=Thiohalocapsa marina TaxID=424902 RepID=A0A5M8FKU5_9GAMM|nr:FGGY-family carbohydrate kinase [Thiohalocapsa marina]KAA6184366.1 FGGY-family carbohydrate kinase [Thiohalocapsa marina]
MTAAFSIGIDLGTSGCRAVVLDAAGNRLGAARVPLAAPVRRQDGGVEQDPHLWLEATLQVLQQVAPHTHGLGPGRLCVDATSATLLLSRPDGIPLGPALMYNDARAIQQARRIDEVAAPASAARGPGSSLAKLLYLAQRHSAEGHWPRAPVLALHQADWISARLMEQPDALDLPDRHAGACGHSDWNNALKLGFDLNTETWPGWVRGLVPSGVQLPRVHPPGSPLGRIHRRIIDQTGLPHDLTVCAGTTDSTAAVIAAGAGQVGDAVTSLGSTLVLKILGDRPIAAPEFGVYSHRLGRHWVAGGASNSGGAVLRHYFADERIQALSARIDPDTASGLDYYPLTAAGERFPFADPHRAPRLAPRPPDDARFLQGLLEGIARIEQMGYQRLAELGAPMPRRILTTGGGARNHTWLRMRQRLLGVPVVVATEQDAAVGAALLALRGQP